MKTFILKLKSTKISYPNFRHVAVLFAEKSPFELESDKHLKGFACHCI